MAVVKSNAYGHGLALVAKLLANFQFPSAGWRTKFQKRLWFGVDSVTEALRLRREGIRNPILVLGYTLPLRLQEAAAENITITVSNFEGLKALAKLRKQIKFHIKIDTGMHRQGFQEDDLPRLIRELQKERLMPEGVYSHLASAENKQFSKNQIAAFIHAVETLRLAGIAPKFIHIASTGGIMRYRLAFANIVRLGLSLYGYLPDRRRGVARPVLTWKTIVSEVKRVKKGERIGYDATERLKRDSTIAVLPIGYWHGFDRRLSKVGEVLIHGRRCRVLGRVSMDMTAVDITDIDSKLKIKNEKVNPHTKGLSPRLYGVGVKIGDEVVLIGRQGREFIGADEMAEKIGTISYEVLTRLNPLIKRIEV